MNRTRTALLARVATATIAAGLAALPATAATAATAAAPTSGAAKAAKPKKVTVPYLIDATQQPVSLSPNGDKVKDRARVPFTLKRKSVVTVKVLRTTGAHEAVFTQKLGTLARGKHAYRWDGKKPGGKVLRDNRYEISLLANPVKDRIKKASDYTYVYVDTRYQPEPLEASSTTVYPNTTVITDQIAFNHGGWLAWGGPRSERISKVTLVVTDTAGNVVRSAPQAYRHELFYPVTWDGRDDTGAAVPAGSYAVHMDVTDAAGNKGTSPAMSVSVSAVPLVVASGTRTVAPVNGTLTPAPASASSRSAGDGGRASTNGGDDTPTEPCGSVFASTVYPAPGASLRSKSGCGWALNEARGSGSLALTDLNAPRGLQSAQLSMRGRPSLDGEVDTAQLALGWLGSGWANLTATSPTAPGEAVTSSPVLNNAWDATRYQRQVGVEWTIRTFGFDSYDVADVTANFTYLTPQAS